MDGKLTPVYRGQLKELLKQYDVSSDGAETITTLFEAAYQSAFLRGQATGIKRLEDIREGRRPAARA